MKKIKQTLATVLCVCILFSMDGINIQAAQAGDQNTLQMEDTTYVGEDNITSTEVASTEVASTEVASTEVESIEATSTEATNIEATSTEATNTEATNTEATNTTAGSIEAASTKATDTEEIAENTQKSEPNIETNEAQAIRENMLLSYMVVGSSYVETPGTQYVLAGIGDGTYKMESATLHYVNTTATPNQEYTVEADTIDEDSALFNMDFADESYKGSYEITAIDYVVDGNTYNIDVTTTGVDAAFGVNQEVETNPDAVVLSPKEQEAEDATVITDANGNELSESDLATAVENASEGITSTDSISSTGSSDLVIVLDPGHGGSDSGTSHNGLLEKNLNLAIAAYCKTELDKYAGVKVYMTRTTDTYIGVTQRADIAKTYGADVLISFHINAMENNTSANGALVIYPNSNYNATIGSEGKALASNILKKLVKLRLKDDGTIIRNCVNDTYADGSLADYYGVIRQSKINGFPGIIIEHAFLTNAGDVSTYLNSDAKLQTLGVADATAIAEYFNLLKGDSSMTWKSIASKSSTSLTLKWNKSNYVDGYQIYRSTSKGGKYKKIATIRNNKTTSYTDKKLKVGKKYYYKIKSTKGSVSYSFSKKMSAYPLASTKISSIKSNGSGSLKIVWSKVKKATGYQVYRSTTKTGTYKKIKTISSGKITSYKDKTVKRGKNYYYKIVTVNSENGKTGYSSKSARVVGCSIAATKIKSITSQQNGRLKIKWSKVKNAKKYQIYRSTSKKGTYKKIATTKKGSTTSYEDKTVKDGITYYYKIRTVNYVNSMYGYGNYSSTVSGKQLATTAITFIQSTNSTSIKVKWSKISGATGYKLYRCEAKSGTYQLVTTITNAKTVKYTDKKCISGKNYYYKVQVVSKTGKSALSDSVECTTVVATLIQSVQSMENNQLNISWTVVSEAEGYRIYRSTSENGTYTKIKTISGSAYANYVDTVTDKGVTYYYKVKAFITSNVDTALEQRDYSDVSNVASGQVLLTPDMNDIIQNENESFTINWSQIAGATGYYLYRKDSETGKYSKIAEIASIEGKLSGTYTDTDVTIGTMYYYKVQAYNTVGTLVGVGDYTSEKSTPLMEE